MTICIGDIHGCIKTLEALLKEIENRWPGEQIMFVGDFVDRGPNSKAVVDLVKGNGWDAVAGNHDLMFVQAVKYGRTRDFFTNGGRTTLRSYGKGKDGDWHIDLDHISWLESLPLYKDYPDIVNAFGLSLRIQHASLAPWYANNIDSACGPNAVNDETSLVWYRGDCAILPEIYQVHGHTTIKEPYITSKWAMIDTGCAYAGKNPDITTLGLTAFRFENGEWFTQKNADGEKN